MLPDSPRPGTEQQPVLADVQGQMESLQKKSEGCQSSRNREEQPEKIAGRKNNRRQSCKTPSGATSAGGTWQKLPKPISSVELKQLGRKGGQAITWHGSGSAMQQPRWGRPVTLPVLLLRLQVQLSGPLPFQFLPVSLPGSFIASFCHCCNCQLHCQFHCQCSSQYYYH